MFLLVGLGNIGGKYCFNRHNYGFLIIDKIINRYNLQPNNIKFKAEFYSGNILNQKIIAIKPQTFMNLSGEAVLATMAFYKIPTQNIIVLHDDLDLQFGRFKYKIGGGNAGHNGLKSIDSKIGNQYFRLRLGIGRPLLASISDFVLSDFSMQELDFIANTGDNIAKNISLLFDGKSDIFLQQLNR